MIMLNIFRKRKNSPIPVNTATLKKEGEADVHTDIEKFVEEIKQFEQTGNENYCNVFLSGIASKKEIIQAAVYLYDREQDPPVLRFLTGYACNEEYTKELTFEAGEGLPGQVILDKKILNLQNVPEGYITVKTGLGEASPSSLLIIPIMLEEEILGVIELASFHNFSDKDESFMKGIAGHLAGKIIS